MVLADTSVWIWHLRYGDPLLSGLLEGASILTHPMILGELYCGNPKNRKEIFQFLTALPRVQTATHDEVMHLVQSRKIYGRGVCWVDMHLLASSLLAQCFLLTRDRRLAELARELGVKVPEPVTQEKIAK